LADRYTVVWFGRLGDDVRRAAKATFCLEGFVYSKLSFSSSSWSDKHSVGASSAAFRSYTLSSSAFFYLLCLRTCYGLDKLDEIILLIFRVSEESLNTGSQASGSILLQLKNLGTYTSLTLMWCGDFSLGILDERRRIRPTLTGRLQEVGINHIDCETCNDQCDGDIVDSVMLGAGVPGGSEDSCQGDSGIPIFDRESMRPEGLDRCKDWRAVEYPPCLLPRDTDGTSETIDTPR
jgi:hypothetical protein